MTKCAVIFLVVVASCVFCVRAHTEVVKPCNNSSSTSLSFSIVSRKNETGHWVAEVKMGPEITDGRYNGGWQIHVDQNTVDNSGKEPIVQIRATITAPAMIAPGYEYFPGIGYYKLHTEGKTWAEAKAACEREKTHLAIINSEAESKVIQQLFARYPNLGGPNVAAFVGFHDKQTEGQYVTIYEEPLASTGFTRWSTIGKQPDDAGSAEDCGSVHRNGGLNDCGCDVQAPFFCEQDIYSPSNGNKYKGHTTNLWSHLINVRIDNDGDVKPVKMGPEITDGRYNGGWQIHVDQNTVDNSGQEPIVQIRATITAPAMIAPGYEYFTGIGYYKLHTEGKTWAEAKAACEREKTHLAIINSEAESRVMQQLFARYPNLGGPNVAAFVGFHDKQTEGQYVTIYGEPLASTGFTRWSTIGKQPDDAGSAEDCGSVHRNGGLNDYGCDVQAPFFCEQDIYLPSNGNKYKGHMGIDDDGDVKHVGNEVDKPEDIDTDVFVIDEIPAE